MEQCAKILVDPETYTECVQTANCSPFEPAKVLPLAQKYFSLQGARRKFQVLGSKFQKITKLKFASEVCDFSCREFRISAVRHLLPAARGFLRFPPAALRIRWDSRRRGNTAKCAIAASWFPSLKRVCINWAALRCRL